jgi:hypothetical protein
MWEAGYHNWKHGLRALVRYVSSQRWVSCVYYLSKVAMHHTRGRWEANKKSRQAEIGTIIAASRGTTSSQPLKVLALRLSFYAGSRDLTSIEGRWAEAE